jgi:hypothetical protein
MRSGTTRFFSAADPQFTDPLFATVIVCSAQAPTLRPAWSALFLLFARKLDPWLDSIHPFA